MKYFEIICSVGVIGTTTDYSEENLIHILEEDNVIAFGEISKRDYNRFGNNPWEEPISTVRWKPSVKKVLELQNI